MTKNIILYTTHCPQCLALELKLKSKGVDFEIFDDQDKMIELGFTSAPMLGVGEGVLTFKDAMKWIGELK